MLDIFEVRFSDERFITASGLSIIGLLLKRTQLAKRLDESKLEGNPKPQISNSDVVLAYRGLLCQGKNDFDHIREMDADPDFYCKALGVWNIPSSETLRQRLDMAVNQWLQDILEANIELLKMADAEFSPFNVVAYYYRQCKVFYCRYFHGLDQKHLQRYLDEFCYRFNRRFFADQLFNRIVFSCVSSHKIMYTELTA